MKNEIIIFEEENIKLEVQVEDDTVWLSQSQMAELFQTTISNINIHIKNIYKERELEKNSTIKDSLIVQAEGQRKIQRRTQIYNLDVIISIGYRVKSKRGTEFRIWANKILKDYLLKGNVVNPERIEYIEKIKTIKVTIDH